MTYKSVSLRQWVENGLVTKDIGTFPTERQLCLSHYCCRCY